MQFIYIAIFAAAVALSCTAGWFFYKKKLPKWAVLTLVPSFFAAAVCLTVVLFMLSPPQVQINGPETVTVSVGQGYTDEGAFAYQGIYNISKEIRVKSNTDYSAVGEYKIIYSVTSGKFYSQAVRHIKVVDETPPVITLNGDEDIVVTDIGAFTEPGFTATDNYDGDITSRVVVVPTKKNDHLYDITYTATDSSGNRTSVSRIIKINDTLPPALTLNSDKEMYVLIGGIYSEPGATARDNNDGNITDKISVTGSVDTSRLGTYDIKYAVTDAAGNYMETVRRVNVVANVDNVKSRIYLTFDDGPSGNVTPLILDILKENRVKATFFIIDYSADKLPLIKRMVNEGHTVGIHGYSHDYKKIYASDNAFMNNIYTLRDKLKSDTGYTATVMRFPGGSSNIVSKRYNKGIMTRLTKRVTKEGWRYFDWNVDSTDAEGAKTADQIFSTVTGNLKKNRSNIVLMHDSVEKITTAHSLERIIEYGRKNGYIFCAFDEKTPDVKHPISN